MSPALITPGNGNGGLEQDDRRNDLDGEFLVQGIVPPFKPDGQETELSVPVSGELDKPGQEHVAKRAPGLDEQHGGFFSRRQVEIQLVW